MFGYRRDGVGMALSSVVALNLKTIVCYIEGMIISNTGF